MEISLLYNQKIVIIKENTKKNLENIYNIFNSSLEKYKNYLTFNKLKIFKENNNNLNKIFEKDIKNLNKIKIKYKVNENDNKIRIFGDTFVKNNRNICYIINNGKKYNLNNYFNIRNKKIKHLVIELVGISKFTNLKKMFKDCIKLNKLPDISIWNINSASFFSYIFYNCSSLSNLPDISKWNINKIVKYKSYVL